MLPRVSFALSILLAACGGSSSNPDAAVQGDAAPPSVRTVTCPPGVVPTVTTNASGDAFMPSSVTINVGGIVKFALAPSHNVNPNPIRPTDPGLMVGLGATACLEFDKAGTFSFICSIHSFAGMITVQ